MIFFLKLSLVLLYCVCIYTCFREYKRYRRIFTIKVVALFSTAILYLIPAIANIYAWARDASFLALLLLGHLGLLASFLFENTVRCKPNTKRPVGCYDVKASAIKILAVIATIFFGITIMGILRRYSWNIIGLLSRNRIEEYSGESTNGMVTSFIETCALICICYYWKNRRTGSGVFIWAMILLYYILSSHTRYVIILHCALPLVFYENNVKKIKPIVLFLFIAAALVFISAANFLRNGIVLTSSTTNMATIFNQLFRASAGSTETFYRVFISEIGCDYLKQYLIYFPLALIPSALWPGKPVVSYFWRMTKALTGFYPFQGASLKVLTSTVLGEAFHEASYLGVLFCFPVYIGVTKLIISNLKKYRYSDLIWYSIIIHIPMDIRGGLCSVLISYVTALLPFVLLRLIGIYRREAAAIPYA